MTGGSLSGVLPFLPFLSLLRTLHFLFDMTFILSSLGYHLLLESALSLSHLVSIPRVKAMELLTLSLFVNSGEVSIIRVVHQFGLLILLLTLLCSRGRSGSSSSP